MIATHLATSSSAADLEWECKCLVDTLGLSQMDAILQKLSYRNYHIPPFYENCSFFLLRLNCSLFPMVQLTINHYCFRKWLHAEQAIIHYLNQWWPSLLMRIWITQLQWLWVNNFSLGHSLSCHKCLWKPLNFIHIWPHLSFGHTCQI